MSLITFDQFNEEASKLRATYLSRMREVSKLQDQFILLVNKIDPTHEDPSNIARELSDEEVTRLEDAYRDEMDEISQTVADLAYDFDLEWSGSYEPGQNEFWQPSTC